MLNVIVNRSAFNSIAFALFTYSIIWINKLICRELLSYCMSLIPMWIIPASKFCSCKSRVNTVQHLFDSAPGKRLNLARPDFKVLLNSDLLPLLNLVSDVRFDISENSNIIGVGSISLSCGSFFIRFFTCNISFFLEVMLVFWKSVYD